MATPRIVGAYAAIPHERDQAEDFYTRLADAGIEGIEVPYSGTLAEDVSWLANQLKPFTESVVTAIPGTMKALSDDPHFGLASSNSTDSALVFVRRMLDEITSLHESAGPVVTRIQLHSAPRGGGDRDALARSLETITQWCEPLNITPVIEHCDDHLGPTPEKGFLTIDDEIAVCRELSLPITVNWGRAVLERHDPERPKQIIETLTEAGILGGIMFSGIGPEQTQFGPVWGDAHLPLKTDEPTSLMTREHVAGAYRAARGAQQYEGVKIQVPNISNENRIAMIMSIFDAMGEMEG